ncbi:hypothetical protein BscR1v2_002160 [Bartonella schoenbuchensis R1]|uniref:Uncharacterized protein n=1 Tax=Bartonella schoenbuchensis (strain DSM 13525 / NCTC 13165 / R1) TaxID=687861 RepID=A0A1S6XNW4_BARSR|nr:hypothetical protein BscR1v2_002160 [Bartonella schoenbuchensis R1]
MLTLAGNVDIQNVNKGILVKDSKSSVIVTQGKIGVRGDYVIGVSNGGTVTLNDGVKVNGGEIVFMGNGKANVSGGAGGATISLANGNSTGVIMQGKGRGEVMNMTITGSGSIGADVSGGVLEVMGNVTIMGTTMGLRVAGGECYYGGGVDSGNGK